MTVRSGPLWLRYCRPASVNEPVLGSALGSVATSHPATRRVAYALGRKLGSAVVRNRLRRQLRAILEECATENSALFPEGDYLVGLKPSPIARGSRAVERKHAHSWSSHELAGHTHRALEKLGQLEQP